MCVESEGAARLAGRLIGIARVVDGNAFLITPALTALVTESLVAVQPGYGNADTLVQLLERTEAEKRSLVPNCFTCAAPCGKNNDYDLRSMQNAPEEVRSLKNRILSRIQEMAVRAGGKPVEEDMERLLYRALFAVGMDDWGREELQPILRELDAYSGKPKAV